MINLKYNFILIAILLIKLLPNAYASDCNLKNARVVYSHRDAATKTTYFRLLNLEKGIQIPITDDNLNSPLAIMLKKSETNKDVFLKLSLVPGICKQVLQSENFQEFLIFPNLISSSKISYTTVVDCINCISLINAPITIALPKMEEMQKILDTSVGFSHENVNLASVLLVHLFERMNSKTPNANSLVFAVSLFKAFEVLNVKSIDRNQLQYLALRFKEQLHPTQFALLQSILNQIDRITFNRDTQGKVVVKLATSSGNSISLGPNEIPVTDRGGREMLQKYFNKIEIENGTSMVFVDQKRSITSKAPSKNEGLNDVEIQAFATPTTVIVQGINIKGQFPIIGGVSIKPQELIVDIDSATPVKANVGFKKGFFGMSYTFDLNN